MKTQLVIYPAMIALLCMSCGEDKKDTYEESIEAQNEMSGPMHEGDTNMVKRDGTLLDGAIDQADTVKLPTQVLEVISNDKALSVDKIRSKRKFTENGITYYEIKFMTPDEKTQSMIFDETGKIKSEDE
ncbi:hypothetical protein [Algoriphagus aquimarinus]|uniref:Uncharacterized protein n=1 Tax=Algoriphagus aquimarinus TaxID=237018 RepID=A0A1I0WBE4_9BACT|nr:hypothetical protein [Algoriphagus aquimarinus]SFA85588.1 hypothetical protein SAMN04489723_10213 [Algoriphagus aquimarinus]